MYAVFLATKKGNVTIKGNVTYPKMRSRKLSETEINGLDYIKVNLNHLLFSEIKFGVLFFGTLYFLYEKYVSLCCAWGVLILFLLKTFLL